jgi:hypothetical protein
VASLVHFSHLLRPRGLPPPHTHTHTLNARFSPHCCACAVQAQSALWVSQPLWGSARRFSMDTAFISSHPLRSNSQLGHEEHTASARATKLVSQKSGPPVGQLAVQQQQQQQQQTYGDRRRSCSAAESQIESQIAGMRSKLLAMASASTGWQPIRLSSDDARAAVPYTPSTMSASLLAQRAAVVARLDAKATQYRDAALKDGSMRRLMLQQMAISVELGRGTYACTDTALGDELIQIEDLCEEEEEEEEASPAGAPAAALS